MMITESIVLASCSTISRASWRASSNNLSAENEDQSKRCAMSNRYCHCCCVKQNLNLEKRVFVRHSEGNLQPKTNAKQVITALPCNHTTMNFKCVNAVIYKEAINSGGSYIYFFLNKWTSWRHGAMRACAALWNDCSTWRWLRPRQNKLLKQQTWETNYKFILNNNASNQPKYLMQTAQTRICGTWIKEY